MHPIWAQYRGRYFVFGGSQVQGDENSVLLCVWSHHKMKTRDEYRAIKLLEDEELCVANEQKEPSLYVCCIYLRNSSV